MPQGTAAILIGPAHRLKPLLETALKGLLIVWIGLSAACIPLITLGFDEAWVLQGMRTWLEPPRANYTNQAIFTSGGLHTLANVLIEWAWGNRVWAHRLFSWACLILLVFLVAIQGRRVGGSIVAGLVAFAALIGLPGLAENGTAALGTACGALLLVSATWIWGRRRSDSPGLVIACGVLFGLAAATRAELVLAVPAVVLSGCLATKVGVGLRPRIPIAELGVALLAGTVFVGNYWAHHAVSPAPELEMEGRSQSAWERVKGPTGLLDSTNLTGPKLLARLKDYPYLLNKVKLAQQFCPLSLLVLASLVPFALALAGDERSIDLVRPVSLFVLIGWTLWLGWIFRAPVPLLRYITPALACFAIVWGLGMARLYGWARDMGHDLILTGLLLLSTAEVLGGAGSTFRSVLQGHHDIQASEWAGVRGLDYFRRFQYIQDQWAAMAGIERTVPKEARLLVWSRVFDFRYLLNRPVIWISEIDPEELSSRRPTYLILPAPISYMSPEGHLWIERNCRLVGEFGRYAIYEVLSPLPQDPGILGGKLRTDRSSSSSEGPDAANVSPR